MNGIHVALLAVTATTVIAVPKSLAQTQVYQIQEQETQAHQTQELETQAHQTQELETQVF